MTRDEIADLAVVKLGDREDKRSAVLAEMVLGQTTRLEMNGRFQPWFMVTEYANVSTVINEPRVALPSDFVSEVEEAGLWWYSETDGVWIQIEKAAEDDSSAFYVGTGWPQKYSQIGDHLTIFPAPDAVYQLRMRYNAAQTVLSSNIENAWTKYAPDLVLYDVCHAIASEDLQNLELAAVFDAQRERAWNRLWLMHESRQHANRQYSMGEIE